ncbi:fimbria/pilus periplasmic chaperone [Sphingomonas sp. HITSZ_GF]|uniref:fimbrial biogenesis chaperone n=1 Tax=Sphingomonas sp. HITSZ_GF TaxID=3037247 RepID=UPI00240DDF59|nr:fimbria/pilus periplasmic chaperone [Sphingomonas sp. HITSZ_GF]MDG2535914.1 fimbria/pilus periplasmic chaperone [Sphingomonas sp. HITSZ_GF]
MQSARFVWKATGLAVLLGLGAAWSCPASAQGLSVDPVVIELPAGKLAGTLRLRNGTGKEHLVQLRAFVWHQGLDGRDQLSPTDDLVIGPPLVRLGPGKEQVVRVLLRAPVEGERAYRIVADRLPEAPKGGQIQVHLTLSLPLFAGVPRQKDSAEPEWGLVPDGKGGSFLTVRNRAGVHLRFDALALRGGTGAYVEIPSNGSRYVLAGGERRWSLPPGLTLAPGQGAQVRFQMRGKTIETAVSRRSS